MKQSTFTIDKDDAADIKKHITILQKRRKKLLLETANYQPINFGISKQNVLDILPIFEHLSTIKFPDLTNEDNKSYYVYLHCNPSNSLQVTRDIRELFLASKFGLTHMPFYVGKGIGERCNDLSRNEGHRKIRSKLLSKKLEIKVVKIFENLTEQEALFEEQKLIALLGLSSLSPSGMLVNLQTDKSILTHFAKAIENFNVPADRALIGKYGADRILGKYKNFIKTMYSWI
jgi:hypothetical protein